jgi:hypothetical protein
MELTHPIDAIGTVRRRNLPALILSSEVKQQLNL